MKKIKMLMLTGNGELGDDFIDYWGWTKANTIPSDPLTGSYMPAPPADIRTNIVLNEGELSLDYYLNDLHSCFSITLWGQLDNLIFVFNEYPSCIAVKKYESGILTTLYSIGHSSATKLQTKNNLVVKNQKGIVTIEVDGVEVIKHPLMNNGLGVNFFAMGNDGLKLSDIVVNTPTPKAFVIMQFLQEYNELYEEVIKPVCLEAGLDVVRADESSKSSSIIEEILDDISSAAIIIADITPDNPNVYYEVGYAHALKKDVVLMCNDQRKVLPFDLKDVRTIFYTNSIAGNKLVKERLKQRIFTIFKDKGMHFQGVQSNISR